jgi:hypothetical protein
MIILVGFIVILIVLYYIMRKKENVYRIAYDLGTNYLNIIESYDINKPAVMFDIDDTLLSVDDTIAFTPIKPIISLLNECIKRNLLVLIITARDSSGREETISQLDKYNIRYSFLYLRQSPEDDHIMFKSNVKSNLLEKYGITTVMSIGDNEIDIIGPNSGYGIKLPNIKDPCLYHINAKGDYEKITC